MGTHLEHLEHRKLFAATAVVQLDDGVLRIGGTDASDDIAIEAGRVQFKAHVNGRVHTFNTPDVRFIRIFGKAGDDSIVVSPRVHIRCSIEGNDGDDRIGGSARNDTIMSGRGDDTITGNGGDDYLDAGADDDTIEDTAGINVIHGGGGNDRSRCDPYQLGSGVEHRQVVGKGGVASSGVTELRRERGRLILTYAGWLPHNTVDEQAGPTPRPSGQRELTTTIHVPELSTGPVGGFDHRWDITDDAAHGVVLTKRFSHASASVAPYVVFSLPLLLPA